MFKIVLSGNRDFANKSGRVNYYETRKDAEEKRKRLGARGRGARIVQTKASGKGKRKTTRRAPKGKKGARKGTRKATKKGAKKGRKKTRRSKHTSYSDGISLGFF